MVCEYLVIVDWKGIERITTPSHANYSYSFEIGIKAGIDMIMVPMNYTEFIDGLTSQVKKNIIPMSIIDDAVKRILRVKFVMGLFEDPLANKILVDQFGNQEHRELAREAVRKSLLLIKNGESVDKLLLPLPKKSSKKLVAGSHADNLGYQCGGESEFQLREVEQFLIFHHCSRRDPYAETFGDSLNLTISEPGPSTIYNVCGAVKCVVVVISGRPVVMQPHIPSMDALMAAWLPGSEGQGVVDILFEDYGFTGKLSWTWFKTVDQLPINVGDPHYNPFLPFGFGLTTKPFQNN
ncbi:hypothetical protein EZV62_007633 [Acer yangbiense]|uniref:Glycoside hydrolase family 3 C-terminal domain-containing protein n=1 Tax=Acer yangbiense TaxID=1000413 RepID=A0A5C7IB39_9ROSI|nr:hypothetical protein EZV62_007633 [Acer yangbiense]